MHYMLRNNVLTANFQNFLLVSWHLPLNVKIFKDVNL